MSSLTKPGVPVNSGPESVLVGKIARLPHDLRDQLNQRLLDGKTGSEILVWLNELPVVKQILAAQFEGRCITKQNLSVWRQLGFQRWKQERQNLEFAKERSQYAQDFTRAAGGRFAPAAAAVASGKIFEFLDAANPKETNPDDLVRCAAAASALLKGEQNYTRIELARERVRQRDDQLLLTRDKHQRDVAAIALRVLGDARAKAIEAAPITYTEKIELIGRHLFSGLWKHRPIPRLRHKIEPSSRPCIMCQHTIHFKDSKPPDDHPPISLPRMLSGPAGEGGVREN